MKLRLISKYRSCLMALAMLWVAIRHSNFPINFKPLKFLLYSCGYGDVDAFLFLYRPGIYFDYLINIVAIVLAFGLAIVLKKRSI